MSMNPTRIGAALLCTLIALTGCGSTGNPTGSEKKIVLEVAGPAAADITYSIGTDQSQEIGAVLPWKKDTTSKDTMLIVVFSAQSKGDGEISCKLSIDGKVVKENKSSGQFAIVTCSNG
jgi:hypothetical protein